MILEWLVAVSLPLWLGSEELARWGRARWRTARAASRAKSRHAILAALLARTDPRPVRRAPLRPSAAASSSTPTR
jgi:hypothetical protein